jgi:quinol monooxygenase YgiN
MHIVTLRIKVPPSQRKNFLDAARMVVGPTQVQPGCISCRFYQDLDDPDTILLMEEWKTRKDLDHHLKSDRYRIVLSLVDISAKPPEFKLNTISKSEGLEAIEVVRGTA